MVLRAGDRQRQADFIVLRDDDVGRRDAGQEFNGVEPAAIGFVDQVDAKAWPEAVGIVAGPADQRVVAGSANQDIIALPRIDPIIASTTGERFTTVITAKHPIVVRRACSNTRHQIGVAPYGAVGEFDLFDPIIAVAHRAVDRQPIGGPGHRKCQAYFVGLGDDDVVRRNTGQEFDDIGAAAVAFIDGILAKTGSKTIGIVPVSADQRIVSTCSDKYVVACSTIDGIVAPAAGQRVGRCRSGQRLVGHRNEAAALEIAQIQAGGSSACKAHQHPCVGKASDACLDKVDQCIEPVGLDQDLPGKPIGSDDIKAVAIGANLEIGDRIDCITPARQRYEDIICVLRCGSVEFATIQP